MPGDLPRPVQVFHDGVWLDGVLEDYQRIGGGWRGLVRYTPRPGSTYLQWRPEAEIRPPSGG